MGLRSWLGLRESSTAAPDDSRAAAAEAHAEVLSEALVDLELALEDRGWKSLTDSTDQDFTRDGKRRAARICRVMAIANPLIKRGLAIRNSYVWGGGVQITARDPEVNEVIQLFLDDPGNRVAFTGDQAHEELETTLGTDGDVYLACFTSPLTGFVQVRTLPNDEVEDVFLNPEDRDDPWFYLRVWDEVSIDTASGKSVTVRRKAYYPALNYRPARRVRSLDGVEVRWDAPVRHVRVNRLTGQKFGVGDAYAALPWARQYRDFLADWATLVKALSQFAWKLTAKNGSRADKLRQAVARGGPAQPGNLGTVGATAAMSQDVNLEAIPKTGATIDSESGRPLAAMVASAFGVPVTMLLSDPGQTGARAVAETLDTPTINSMNQRRSVWTEAFRAILEYVILSSVRAPKGPLRGTITRDPYTGRESFTLAGSVDITMDVEWPPLEDTDVKALVDAVVAADGTAKLPPLVIVRELLAALGVKDADEIVDQVTDENGEWLDPYASVGTTTANAAIAAFRRGEDPAAVVGGQE